MASNTMQYNLFFHSVIHAKVSLNILLPVTGCTCKYQKPMEAIKYKVILPTGVLKVI